MNAGLTIFALESTLKETGEHAALAGSGIFGRASTFYPLTLSFVLRDLPMRFVLVWIGMYATNIIFTTDMAQA